MALGAGRIRITTAPVLVYSASDWTQITITAGDVPLYVGATAGMSQSSGLKVPAEGTIQTILLAPGDNLPAVSEYTDGQLYYLTQSVPWSMKMLKTLGTG